MITTLLTVAAAPAAQQPAETDVFVSGKGGYHTYRIPALLVTPAGTLLTFCEGRKTGRSDHGDLDLILRRSTDNGKTWGPIELIYEEGGEKKITIGNPCPVVDQATGTIWLPFTRNNDDVLMTHSTDDGKTWAKPTTITGDVKKPGWGWYATGPGVGIQLRRGRHKGRMVIPCDHREKKNGKSMTLSHCIFSDDGGKSWKLGESVADHTNECQVIERPDGALVINMRNYWAREGKVAERGGKRAVSTSTDGGETWSDLRFDETLIEPTCQAGFLRYSWPAEGRSRLLFSNPASTSKRHRLTIRMSTDEGKTWPVSKLLYEGGSAYSCLTVLPDKKIGLIYEKDGYKKLVFVSFGLDWLTKE